MLYISRSELNRMEKNVIDRKTGMTEADYFEANHCHEDWQVIEDV